MEILLAEDARVQAIASIRRYFDEELDQQVGELQAGLFLDFVLKEIAPSVYNAAVADAQGWIRDRLSDLDGACFVPEFGYWPRGTTRRPTRGST